MEKVNIKIAQLESAVAQLDQQVKDQGKIIGHMKPVVEQASHKNVVITIATVITILNLIILILHETSKYAK